MKKVMMTIAVIAGMTATAQVKVGANPTTLATNANFQVEGSTGKQVIVLQNGNVGIGLTTPDTKLTILEETVGATVLRIYGAGATNDVVKFADVSIGGQSINGSFLQWSRDGNEGNNFAIFTKNYAGTSSEKFRVTGDGNVSIVNTPTITTATKVLVKEPVTNIISEQVVNGIALSAAAPVAAPVIQTVVAGSTHYTTTDTGVIMKSADGKNWMLTIANGGVVTVKEVTP